MQEGFLSPFKIQPVIVFVGSDELTFSIYYPRFL